MSEPWSCITATEGGISDTLAKAQIEGSTMDGVTLIGLAAAGCTTIAFVPQVIKTWRTRSTADILLATFSIFTLGIALWLIYGPILVDVPSTWIN